MTDRLYYADAYLREFDAVVTRVGQRDGRAFVVLDRTAFYPTSGGQPFDLGTLEGDPERVALQTPERVALQTEFPRTEVGRPFQGRLHVIDVVDDDNGDVAHVVDGPAEAFSAGQPVHGAIDWTRRFDHMQQHTGQHVLSAAIDRLFGARTVSFHLGTESSTIDVSRELTHGEIVSAEVEANRIVWDNHPVSIRYASAEDAAKLPLRKESVREGTLRLVDIEHVDLSACGGTHVATTGGIGVIAIGATERFKGGQRIEFFCGGRALTKFRSMRDALSGAVRVLSVLPDELPPAIEKLQADARERQKTLVSLQQDLARHRAEEFVAAAEPAAAGRLVARAVDADAGGLKSLASAITSRPGHIAVLVSTARPVLVVVARSQDVAVSAHQIIKTLTEKFGGRGGGKPDLAQAGGLDGEPGTILAAGRSLALLPS
jgi:alanyl-tRNA synthetase